MKPMNTAADKQSNIYIFYNFIAFKILKGFTFFKVQIWYWLDFPDLEDV